MTKNKSDNFNQRYSLSLDKSLFPTLRLVTSGIFEKDMSWITTNDSKSDTSVTTLRPSVDLTLNTLLYTAGIGYNRRDETSKTSGTPDSTAINEDFHALFGWRPVGLPKVDLLLTRSNTFDASRLLRDSTNDRVLLSMRYLPLKSLDLKYQGVYSDATDRLQGFESRELTNSGRFTYSDQFFKQRLLVNTTYNVTRQDTKTFTTGAGEIPIQLFPFNGLYAPSDTPAVAALASFPALINGDAATSAGIDSLGVPTPGNGETRPRNIGVDFVNPTEVNTLFVFVDRDLPPGIANFFSWDVYTTSEDPGSGNPEWTLVKTIAAAPFTPFLNSFRFQIDFPNVTARAVKVVVTPLTPVAAALTPTFQNPDRIFVTEVQAYIRKSANEVKGDAGRTSHIYNMDVKARLLDVLALYYDGSFFFTRTSPSSTTRYTLSNGLHLDHTFNDMISGSSRVAREDDEEPDGHRVSYLYSASLKAVPVKTLSHTLIYSGRNEAISGKTKNTNSLTLYNYAELYKGLNLNLSGGATFVTTETGVKEENYNVVFGANIVPNKTLSMNVNYTFNKTNTTGGLTSQATGLFQQRAELNATFRPFATLYLFASLGMVDQDSKTDTLMNYGANWSPFPDGTIQFNFSYNESLRTQDNSKIRLITPSLSWKVTSYSLLDVAYAFTTSDSITQTVDSKIFNVNYKIFF
ncbi:hypothetical protein [Geotalea uraniireducens]|nr:hypothetical protein [Geotalea uraniireducens]